MHKKKYICCISWITKLSLIRRFIGAIRNMSHPNLPIGCKVLSWLHAKCCPRLHINRIVLYKISVLGLTYASYMCYHMTRKTLSVVKSVLHRNCSDLPVPHGIHLKMPPDETWCDYPPFDGPDASTLLGTLDSAFLFSYGIAMFISGFVAERVSLRYFLTLGMLFSGIFCYLFGMAKVYDIHSLMYFMVVQALAGIFQTTGWPGVVTLVGRWFGKSKRGLIFGIWNSHTSIGNILGSVIAGYYVEKDWSLSFIVPGFIMGLVGFVIFLFIVEDPSIAGLNIDAEPRPRRNSVESGQISIHDECEALLTEQQDINVRIVNDRAPVNERSPILSRNRRPETEQGAIGFIGALKIPGVVEFSLCLFFSKLVSYTFLFWLPLYIQSSTSMSAQWSANVSTVFDFGGILGAILAGFISDYTGMSALTCTSMLFLTAPLLFIYEQFGTASLFVNIFLLFICGCFVNGPYALITTSVSAELGTHSSLQGNSKALATVTSIIDGTGSLGAAIGPLLAGVVSSTGWDNVFYMLIFSDVVALFLLLRLVKKEIDQIRRRNARIE
ncbi:glucose-6-phosphate exchanger SLC37A2 isoform X2 [Culicoides brevitarsis]|uniref:glucose-6-phosphate exchanger SLC37A2 isoform X2 n=1 Tax=Culicoides brevitarsis TaxID=469753 RepID=UPI00307C89EE